MKKILYLISIVVLAAGCATDIGQESYRVHTEREKPYYLGSNAEEVTDTCPGGDILKQYSCTKDDADGLECFDVYMVQGSPVNEQKYTLLQQTVEKKPVTPEPACPKLEQADCASFLKALNYNLEFSWYLVNFPSSSFEECRETYDCKRVDCFVPPDTAAGETDSTLISCVYKRNQLFFVGSAITCQHKAR